MTMPVVTLNCNNCGAPLSVPDSTRFLTCQFCQSQLEVKHAGNAAFTQVLEELQEQTDQITAEVKLLRLQNELLLLEQHWDRRSRDLMVHNKEGRPSVPTMSGVALTAGFGGLFTVFAGFVNILFGGVCAVIVAFAVTQMWTKANAYASAEQRYRFDKRRIQAEINRCGRGDEIANWPHRSR